MDPNGLWSLYRWIYTGDGDASDEAYEGSLDQGWDTMQKAAKSLAQKLAVNTVEETIVAIPVLGPFPKKWAVPLGGIDGIRVPPGLEGNTSGIRIASTKYRFLEPIAQGLKKSPAIGPLIVADIICINSMVDTWNDPEVWTLLDSQ